MAATSLAALRRQDEDEGEVVLRCFDGVELAVPTALARRRSGLVLEAGSEGEGVVLYVPVYVSGRVVEKVIAYWEARAVGSVDDGEFLGGLRHDMRVDLIYAAHHLRDAALFDLFRFRAAA